MLYSVMKKDIGNYIVYSDGNVWSKYYNRFIKPSISNTGYYRTALDNKKVSIHRLVAECFIPNTENKSCVNHKDGNRLNNNSSNLEWSTYSENIQHAWDNKLCKSQKGKPKSVEHIANMKVSAQKRIHTPHSEETNQKIREAAIRRYSTTNT